MKTIGIIILTATLSLGGTGIALAQSAPTSDPTAAQNPAINTANDATVGSLAKGHNSFTKGEARGRMEKAGYSHISGLTLDADGLWQARATFAGAQVHVAMDYKGVVASQ